MPKTEPALNPVRMMREDDHGRRFGRYRLKRSLGSGGMAQVFEAELPMMEGRFGKRFAIKRILPCFSDEPEFVDLLLDEARITLQLNHPNIVQTHEIGQVDGHTFIVMEFIDGPTLSTILRCFQKSEEPFPLPAALYIARELAAGLDAAHSLEDQQGKSLKLIHRDVSPHNVMIDRNGLVKIIDFGVARARDRIVMTMDGAVRGKPSFFSPERADGEDFDHRADLFALGLILWTMLTGEHPTRELGRVESLLAMQKWTPELLSNRLDNVPPGLDALLLKVLAKEADDRPDNGETIRKALDGILHEVAPGFSSKDLAALLRRFDLLEDRLTELWVSSADLPVASDILPLVAHGPALEPDDTQRTQKAKGQEPGALERCDESSASLVTLGAEVESSLPESAQDPAPASLISDRPTITHEAVQRIERLIRDDSVPLEERRTMIFEELIQWRTAQRRRDKPRRLPIVLMFCLSVAFGFFGAFLVSKVLETPSSEPITALVPRGNVSPETTASPIHAVLELATTPSGAQIFVNTVATGIETPAELDIPVGKNQIRLEKAGYRSRVVTVTLDAGRRKVMQVGLEREFASVEIHIVPSTTAVLEFPSLAKKYLVVEGEPITVDGLRVGVSIEVRVSSERGVSETFEVTPRMAEDTIVLNLDRHSSSKPR